MDLILLDVVAREVSHGLHGACLSVDLHLVALHHLLDGSADIADSDVDSSILYTVNTVQKVKYREESLW